MLDNINGIPTHALLVHAVVVLLPLAALGGIAVALVPALRRRYGGLVLLLTIVAAAAVPVTQKAGQRLFDRLSARFGPNDVAQAGLMQRHADLAHKLLPWALLLLAGVDQAGRAAGRGGHPGRRGGQRDPGGPNR